MIKLSEDNLAKFNNSTTELRGILLGSKKDGHDKPIFIDYKNRDSDLGNKNLLIIGKQGLGKGFYVNYFPHTALLRKSFQE